MSEKLIILCIVLAGVAAIAFPFIRRALRHRNAIGSTVPKKEISMQTVPPEPSFRDIYLMRFIALARSPFRHGRSVLVRPRYHLWIKMIIRSIGEKDMTITEYVDKVLKAHFDDNRKVINELYDENLNNKIVDNGCD